MLRSFLTLVCASLSFACGSTPDPAPATDAGQADAGGPNPCLSDAGWVITYTSTGVSPKTGVVDAGTVLLVRNDDSQSHQLASEPHPVHDLCPQINTRLLQPNECQVLTLGTAGDCPFHDHTRPTNNAFSGELTVQ